MDFSHKEDFTLSETLSDSSIIVNGLNYYYLILIVDFITVHLSGDH